MSDGEKCRPVIVRGLDGEEIAVRVRGESAMDAVDLAHFGEIVRAALRYHAELHGEAPDVGGDGGGGG